MVSVLFVYLSYASQIIVETFVGFRIWGSSRPSWICLLLGLSQDIFCPLLRGELHSGFTCAQSSGADRQDPVQHGQEPEGSTPSPESSSSHIFECSHMFFASTPGRHHPQVSDEFLMTRKVTAKPTTVQRGCRLLRTGSQQLKTSRDKPSLRLRASSPSEDSALRPLIPFHIFCSALHCTLCAESSTTLVFCDVLRKGVASSGLSSLLSRAALIGPKLSFSKSHFCLYIN